MPKVQAKLKVFKGFSMLKENNLTDIPCAVVACYTDTLTPRVPGSRRKNVFLSIRIDFFSALAVASGASVFIFKALRPYYKFVLPQLDMAQVEKDVWSKAKEVCRNERKNNRRSIRFVVLFNREILIFERCTTFSMIFSELEPSP